MQFGIMWLYWVIDQQVPQVGRVMTTSVTDEDHENLLDFWVETILPQAQE